MPAVASKCAVFHLSIALYGGHVERPDPPRAAAEPTVDGLGRGVPGARSGAVPRRGPRRRVLVTCPPLQLVYPFRRAVLGHLAGLPGSTTASRRRPRRSTERVPTVNRRPVIGPTPSPRRGRQSDSTRQGGAGAGLVEMRLPASVGDEQGTAGSRGRRRPRRGSLEFRPRHPPRRQPEPRVDARHRGPGRRPRHLPSAAPARPRRRVPATSP